LPVNSENPTLLFPLIVQPQTPQEDKNRDIPDWRFSLAADGNTDGKPRMLEPALVEPESGLGLL
jgi:hypothetical protein